MKQRSLLIAAAITVITAPTTTLTWYFYAENYTPDSLSVKATYSGCGDDNVTLAPVGGQNGTKINAKDCLLRKLIVNNQVAWEHSGYRTSGGKSAVFHIRKKADGSYQATRVAP